MKKQFCMQLKKMLPVIGIFVLTMLLCAGSLLLTALIPQDKISANLKKSAVYFEEHELFPYLAEGQFNTRQDNYADCILLNIIYHIGVDEQESLFSSVIRSAYFCREKQNVNEGFSEAAAFENTAIPQEAKVDYFRYWHGSMVLLRPLLILFDIVGVRLVLGIAALLLSIAAAYVLWKKKRKVLSACYLLSMICVNSWVIVCCIEYVTTFLVMGACNLWIAGTWKEEYAQTASGQQSAAIVVRRKRFLCLMAVSGVVTSFMDFLTTETLTFTVPVLLELVLCMGNRKKLEDVKGTFLRIIQSGIVWGVSYAVMFVTKWIISAGLLGVEALREALQSAGERLGGTVYLGVTNLDPEADFFQRVFGAVFRNEGMIFPFKDHMSPITAAVIFGVLLMVLFSVIYLFYDKDMDLRTIGLFLLVALIPYLRYVVLSNHAYIHYFFTYRAQLVTIMILLFLVWEYGLGNIFGQTGAKCADKKKK